MTENELNVGLKGLNLSIDPAIDKVCETSNKSSSNTRSIMYVLVVVSILSLISVMNTHYFNWTKARMTKTNEDIATNDSLLNIYQHLHNSSQPMSEKDSIRLVEELTMARANIQLIRRNQIENFQTVKVPILGNAFDVNNLSLVAGITILVLLYILKFTMYREITNLRIALNSISERYPSNADKEVFKDFFPFVRSLNVDDHKFSDADLLSKINLTRRIYHYNFLSMNEVFNLPPVKYSVQNELGFSSFILMNIFYFPTIAYTIVFLNDLSTIKAGFDNAFGLTLFTLAASLFLLYHIFRYSRQLTSQKRDLYNAYENFRKGDYHLE